MEKFGHRVSKLFKSSWGEYIQEKKVFFCEKNIVLDQFGNRDDYKEFAKDSLERIEENKQIKNFLLEH